MEIPLSPGALTPNFYSPLRSLCKYHLFWKAFLHLQISVIYNPIPTLKVMPCVYPASLHLSISLQKCLRVGVGGTIPSLLLYS